MQIKRVQRFLVLFLVIMIIVSLVLFYLLKIKQQPPRPSDGQEKTVYEKSFPRAQRAGIFWPAEQNLPGDNPSLRSRL
jgi:hypothetical protein